MPADEPAVDPRIAAYDAGRLVGAEDCHARRHLRDKYVVPGCGQRAQNAAVGQRVAAAALIENDARFGWCLRRPELDGFALANGDRLVRLQQRQRMRIGIRRFESDFQAFDQRVHAERV